MGQTRRSSCLGMSASPQTPDVSLRGNELTLRATRRHRTRLFDHFIGCGESSEGEIVTLFQKKVSFNVPRDGWWVSDVWSALDGRIPPGLRMVPTSHSLDRSGDFERLLDCGVKVSVPRR